jgi:hypothetical protein
MRIGEEIQTLLREDYVALTALRRRPLRRCIHLLTRAFENQKLLLPFTSRYLGRTNLDIAAKRG